MDRFGPRAQVVGTTQITRGLAKLGLGLGSLAVLLLLYGGCSDDKKPPIFYTELGLPDGPLRPDIGADLPPPPDLGATDPNGPVITFELPKDNETIIGGTLLVRAKITDPDGVDDQTVKLSLQGQPGEPVVMGLTTTANVYEALLDVSKVNGAGRLLITATDLSRDDTSGCPCKNGKTREFTRDPGPRIIFTSPGQDSRHKSSVSIKVRVEDSTEITDFKVSIGSQVLTLVKTVLKDETNSKVILYSGTVKFDDPMFAIPLAGTQVLTASGTNKNGASNVVLRRFVIDDAGPAITSVNQAAGDLIGGVIKIEATVSDAAGVLASSVKVVIGNNLTQRLIELTAKQGSTGSYEGQFDTRTLPNNVLFPVMSFRAADKLGNESTYDFEVAVDNGQPLVSLDPPTEYFYVKEDGPIRTCSLPMDPVGDDAASDQEVVPQIVTLRARVEDQGNGSSVPSAEYVPIAGLEPTSVKLHVLDDTTQALVIDTTGDGYCDAINPAVLPLAGSPQPGQAVSVDLLAVPPGGEPIYTPPPAALPPSSTYVYALHPACNTWGFEDPPDALCSTTEPPAVSSTFPGRPVQRLTTAMSNSGIDTEPSIWVPGPVISGDKHRCAGLPFDLAANQFAPGWFCVAVEAKDLLGLIGVSPPLRLFYDNNATAYIKGVMASGTAPSCTGTLNKTTGVVDASTPCKFRVYGGGVPFPQTYAPAEALLP